MPSVLPSEVHIISNFAVSDTVVPMTTPSCSDLAASANFVCLTKVPFFVVAVIGDGAALAGAGVAVVNADGVVAGVRKRRRCDFFRIGVVPNIKDCILEI